MRERRPERAVVFQVPESVQEVADPTGPAEPQDLRIGAEVGQGWAGPTAKELEGGWSLRLRNTTQGRASSLQKA